MRLTPVELEALPGWSPGAAAAAWPAFLASSRALIGKHPELRTGVAPGPQLVDICRAALEAGARAKADAFFRTHFQAYLVSPGDGAERGFVTGYYEPEIRGSLVRTDAFSAPVLSRPDDLIDMRLTEAEGWDRSLEGARVRADGALEPYPDRAAIESGAIADRAQPIVWLADHVEVFFAQVQGSARVRLDDGRAMRLVYAGRNGRPYTSIGRILIETGAIPADEMSLARCKQWLRANGLAFGDAGRSVLQRNQSYVFFRLEEVGDPSTGPIGAQGIPLSPFNSIAIDRTIWPYGTPVWIDADLNGVGLEDPYFRRLMIAQDTGSAIVGPARGDLFIGTGDRAGEIAGKIRHSAQFFVLTPAEA